MMRTDSKGRSASPHRITYKSDFHAVKCSFDAGAGLQPESKGAAAHCSPVHSDYLPSSLSDPTMSHSSTSTNTSSRGRVSSTRGTKIRDNIFLQMDSQQLRQDGGAGLSSTALLSPHNPSLQQQTSPFSGSRRSTSSVLNSVASISNPDSFLQDRFSRSEEVRDINRAALAQKVSVTRRLFETKMMEVGGGGGAVSKPVTGRGSKGTADGKMEDENGRGGEKQVEKDYVGGKRVEVDGFYEDKSINLPVIFSLRPPAEVSVTRHPRFPLLDGPGDMASESAFCSSTHVQTTRRKAEESATANLCFTPEEPVRAELVNIQNESSESDENEGEKEQKEDKSKTENNMTHVEALVDDVFEETVLETTPSLETRAGEAWPEHQEELSISTTCQGESKDDVEKVKEKNKLFVSCAEKSADVWHKSETKTDSRAEENIQRKEGCKVDEEAEGKKQFEGGLEECRQSEVKNGPENEEERKKEFVLMPEHGEEVVRRDACRGGSDRTRGEEHRTRSAPVCGDGNKAVVSDQESQAHPEDSPRRLHPGSQLQEYEEIPGLPDQEEDASEEAKRKVRFSSAPIKVRKKNDKSSHYELFHYRQLDGHVSHFV